MSSGKPQGRNMQICICLIKDLRDKLCFFSIVTHLWRVKQVDINVSIYLQHKQQKVGFVDVQISRVWNREGWRLLERIPLGTAAY